ncbi:MAG TPA: glycosyltransferase family 4 protein [Vicinamibacterales bacterium]|nr:glycosyltransferase family 4 protein [Vicinamibacterales bacterium]
MRVALVAPPFIAVPPSRYGGTELFLALLARGLTALGHEPVVYSIGASHVPCELRWTYRDADWPIDDPHRASLKNLTHSSWAVRDAADHCDVIHVNDVAALHFSEFVDVPFVHTLHHPHVDVLSELYSRYRRPHYIAISDFQRRQERLSRCQTIYHGIDASQYTFVERKQDYLCFLGRMTPCKAPHLAIEIARRTGLPLKLAGEVQPLFADYWEREVKPHLDGRTIEYVGEADLQMKNELLGNARALLFPIQWNEPFGLIMIEAMACGTPVLALAGGSVTEVVGDAGVVCQSVEEMVDAVRALDVPAARCRRRVEMRFSVERMAREYEKVYASVAATTRIAAGQALATRL